MEKTWIFTVCFLSFMLCSYLGYLPHLTQELRGCSVDIIFERLLKLFHFQNPQNLTDRLLETFSKYVPCFKPQKTHWIQKLYQGLTSSWNDHFSRRAATRHWHNEMSNCRIFIRFVGCLILITKIINHFRSQQHFKKKGAHKKHRRKRRHDEQNAADHSSGVRENVEACSSVPSGCELIVCQKTVRKQECIEYILNEGEERMLITREMIYQHTKYVLRRDDRLLNEE